jgi:hypothetical protein
MPTLLGERLNRLIKENAYAKGKCMTLEAEITHLQQALKAKRKTLQAAKVAVARTEALIPRLSAIDPVLIRSIRSMPRTMQGKHGEFRKELVRLLQEAAGPVRTSDLVKVMAVTFQMPVSTSPERQRANSLVRRPLLTMLHKGAVRRLPSPDAQGYGVWEWIAGESASEP